MSYIRFQLDLAIPEPLPQEVSDKLYLFKKYVKLLKTYAVTINAGLANEELTTRAVWHRCHPEGRIPCEPEQEV